MVNIVGISGSLRSGSLNTALLKASSALVPSGVRLDLASIKNIPLYDGDIEEREGLPSAVKSLKSQIVHGQGLLLVTPEYNNSIPGVLKNAIDWLSRPPDDVARLFGGRPVAIMGASTGGFGTLSAQNAWLPVLKSLGMIPWFGKALHVSRAGKVFNEKGEIVDEKVREQLRRFLHGFADFVQSQRFSDSAAGGTGP
jgi:NAD(P)H-dependent FMN reductase